jgi:hypothetical protein
VPEFVYGSEELAMGTLVAGDRGYYIGAVPVPFLCAAGRVVDGPPEAAGARATQGTC